MASALPVFKVWKYELAEKYGGSAINPAASIPTNNESTEADESGFFVDTAFLPAGFLPSSFEVVPELINLIY